MIAFIFFVMVVYFLAAIANAVSFGKKGGGWDLFGIFTHLGLAIWGLILIVLNWS